MRKLIRLMLSALALVALVCACALADEIDDALLQPASPDLALPADYVPENLKQISPMNPGVYLVTARSMLLREEALQPLYDMMQAAEADGVTLFVRQAYRSYADEERRYEMLSSSGQAAQRAGESSYQTGLSVTLVGAEWRTKDLTEDFAKSPEAQWLSEHAAEYGFVLRYPKGGESVTGWSYEPWHYRYVGVAAASAMMDEGLCLDELAAERGIEALPAAAPKSTPKASAPKTTAEPAKRDDPDEADEEAEEEPEEDDLPPDWEGEEEDEPSRPVREKKEHPVPPAVDLDALDPEDIGPDGDYEVSLFDE